MVDGDEKLGQLAKVYRLWLPEGVIFEVAFTLESFYKQSRQTICEWMHRILMKPDVECERNLFIDSLLMYRDNLKFSLVDCYLASLSRREKTRMVTYDEKLAKATK